MEPFYFGEDGRLFGIFHMAGGTPRSQGLLIAGPLLNEGIRAHYALRQVAMRSAAAGYDVLRFDYAGMGNSLGMTANYSLGDWSRDVVDAANELDHVSGSRVTTVMAARFGATLVSALVEKQKPNRIVLWDPMMSGGEWLDRLRESRCNLPRRLQNRSDDSNEYLGHRVGDGFADDLLAISPAKLEAESISLVSSSRYELSSELQSLTSDVELVEPGCHWEAPTSDLLYSFRVIEALCQRVE